MIPNPIGRLALISAAATIALTCAAFSTGVILGDERVLRLPVFLALLSLSGGLGAALAVWRVWADTDDGSKTGVLLCGAAIIAAAWQIGFLHVPSDDYRLYELAARRWVAGDSLYAELGHTNLPVVLLAVGAIRVGLQQISSAAAEAEVLWRLTYGVYEVTQLVSVIALIAALHTLALRAGANPARAAMLAGGLCAFALPVRESLANNQVNLPVVVLATFALAVAAQRPIVAGVFAAVSGAVKLYPFALLAEWALGRNWKAASAMLGSVAAILVLFWPHWVDYGEYLRTVPVWDAYRHPGLHAILMNTTRDVVLALGGGEGWRGVASVVWGISIIGVGAWMVTLVVSDTRRPAGERRPLETGARVLASVLLVFPLAWTHHFIFALPLVVCLWAGEWPSPRVVLGTALLLFVPAFDVYPLGAHRLLGLILLLVP